MTCDVAGWLRSLGHDVIASRVAEHDVNGATLLKLTAEGWAELGATSAIQQAKLMAAVERIYEDSKTQVPHFCSPPPAPSADDLYCLVRKRTPEVGAEHLPTWFLAISAANGDPAMVKEHALRFVAMYNVVDLLVFTVGMSYVIVAGPATTWLDIVEQFLIILSTGWSGLGVGISAIFYNTCSAVSVANFQLFSRCSPTIATMKWTNDVAVLSSFGLLSVLPVRMFKNCFAEPGLIDFQIPNDGPHRDAFVAVRALTICVLPTLCLVSFMSRRTTIQTKLGLFTHYAMHGGLFSDVEVLPEGESAGWGCRCTPEEADNFVGGLVAERLRQKDCHAGVVACYMGMTRRGMPDKPPEAQKRMLSRQTPLF